MNKKSEMQHNPCFDSAQLNKSLELSITKDELGKALFKIYKLQQHIKKLKQQVERANEIEAAAVEKYFTKLQKEYEPYGLLKTYTAFDVARHIEAQGKHFAEQIRQQATEQ